MDLFWKIVNSEATADGLQIRGWDSEYVIHHLATGDTHLINQATQVILRQLLQSDANVSHLANTLASLSDYEADTEADLWQIAQEILGELERLDIVEQVAA